jgi:redox-sensitive bicupin YhaK (pirin superfamily)
MKPRKPTKIINGREGTDGAGVKLIRLFSHDITNDFDPFLMMDAFDSVDPEDYNKGFPWHPHRGIETITYIVDGGVEHQDSLGNSGVINSGDAQWMTAGSGIIHNEMPVESKRMRGFQLWLNLPKQHKMTSPSYNDIKNHDIPVVKENENIIRIISGEYDKTKGAFQPKYIQPLFLDITLTKNNVFELGIPSADTLFIYVLEGEVSFTDFDDAIAHKNVVLFDKGDTFNVKSVTSESRILLFSAKPINEPVAWAGPIVMNTEAELEVAFAQLQRGTFVQDNHK